MRFGTNNEAAVDRRWVAASDQGLPAAPAGPGRPRRGGLGGGYGASEGPEAWRAATEARPEILWRLVPEPRHGTSPGTASTGPFAPTCGATIRSPWPMCVRLDALALAVETKAEAMGFSRPDRQVPPGELAPYIEFLNQLPEFRDDQERRRAGAGQPAGPGSGRGQAARVAKLIRDLDQVAARQWGQPGGVILGESPIIKDLIAQGDAAVEPLIRAFRFDDRLTRSVGFHRDFFRSRTHPAGRPGRVTPR